MLQINKYAVLIKRLPQVGMLRYSCGGSCPPQYECKQPPSEKSRRKLNEEDYQHPAFMKIEHKDPGIYKNIFFFIGLPIVLFFFIDLFYIHPEKPKRPKFVEYTYLRIRKNPFPWDPVRTLFHNPTKNALPTGYEEDDPEIEEIDTFESK